jgi:hypothetical protein
MATGDKPMHKAGRGTCPKGTGDPRLDRPRKATTVGLGVGPGGYL